MFNPFGAKRAPKDNPQTPTRGVLPLEPAGVSPTVQKSKSLVSPKPNNGTDLLAEERSNPVGAKSTRAARVAERQQAKHQAELASASKREVTEESILSSRSGLWLDLISDRGANGVSTNSTALLTRVQFENGVSSALVHFDFNTLELVFYREESSRCKPSRLALSFAPSSLCSFYMNEVDDTRVTPPCIGLGFKSSVYVVRDQTVAFELALPNIQLSPVEHEVWNRALYACFKELEAAETAPIDDLGSLFSAVMSNVETELRAIRQTANVLLSSYSREFLGFGTANFEKEQVIAARQSILRQMLRNAILRHGCKSADQLRNTALEISDKPVVTAMAEMPKHEQGSSAYSRSGSLLAIGTEQGVVYLLDPAKHVYVATLETYEPVAYIVAAGSLRDYQVVTASRDGTIFKFTRAKATEVRKMEAQVVGMAQPSSKSVAVALSNRLVVLLDLQHGTSLLAVRLASPITCISPFKLQVKSISGFIVATLDGSVRIYRGRRLLSLVRPQLDEVPKQQVVALFGEFGREEHCLVLINTTGEISVKFLRRTLLSQLDRLQLESHCGVIGELLTKDFSVADIPETPEQDTPIPIPKKSHLFTDWMEREKNEAEEMHSTFQMGLQQLRLTVAEEYAKVLTDKLCGSNCAQSDCLRVETELLGIGPLYNLLINVWNVSKLHSLSKVTIFLSQDNSAAERAVYMDRKTPELYPEYRCKPAAHYAHHMPPNFQFALLTEIQAKPSTSLPVDESLMSYVAEGKLILTFFQNDAVILKTSITVPSFLYYQL